ncbi:MAG: thioredoxin domain-containing protein [Bacteroidetes bacterium]|jgi:predicted DsbA family dithiol-disulfide isomerase|nr:thioredoxin domain-containing protein [Bacteroidota bacterium]
MRVDIYSDIACPWCYIGERRFARALADRSDADAIEVAFQPFQLDPDLPETPQPLMQRLAEKFGAQKDAAMERVTAMGEEEGLTFQFDDALAVNTFMAHRLLWLAEQEAGPAAQRSLAEKLFAAHFTHGENIADPGVLTDLATTAGLDREQAHAFLASDEGAEEVQALIERAQRLGIRAVPTFVFNNESAVQGAQSADTFRRVLDEVMDAASASG